MRYLLLYCLSLRLQLNLYLMQTHSKASSCQRQGFSLTEVLVVMGIMAVLGLAFMQMMNSQQKSSRALSDKMATLDLQNLLLRVYSSPDVCRFDLTNTTLPANPGNPQKFTDTLPTAIAPISLSTLHWTSQGATPPTLVSVGSNLASPMGSNLKIASIQITGITKVAPKQYQGQLQVAFSGSSTPPKAVGVSVIFQTDGGALNPGKETITDCSFSASAGSTPPGTPCGTNNKGLTMYPDPTGSIRYCCYVGGGADSYPGGYVAFSRVPCLPY